MKMSFAPSLFEHFFTLQINLSKLKPSDFLSWEKVYTQTCHSVAYTFLTTIILTEILEGGKSKNWRFSHRGFIIIIIFPPEHRTTKKPLLAAVVCMTQLMTKESQILHQNWQT